MPIHRFSPRQLSGLVKVCLFTMCFLAPSLMFAQQTRYYRDLVMRGTPYAGLTPRSEIRPEHRSPVEFYKADFDKSGNLTKLEYHFQGKISGRIQSGPGRMSYGAPQIKITYESDKEIRAYFNVNGKPMRNTNGVFKDEYTLDKNGVRESLVYLDSLGNRTANSRGVYRYEWQTKENGALVIEKRYDQNGEMLPLSNFMDFYVTHITFTPNGFRTGFINYGKDGKRETLSAGRKVSRTKVTWDEGLGNEQIITFMGLDGKPKNLAKLDNFPDMTYGQAYEYYDFDALGNQISFRTVDQDGRLINQSGQNFAYQYFPRNEQGLPALLVNYDHGMNMVPDRGGALQTKLEYDDRGNLSKISSLDYYGQLMANNNGVAYRAFESDSEGRIIRVSYHGVNGEIVESPNGAAIIKISYDTEGKSTDLRYNRQGELIKS